MHIFTVSVHGCVSLYLHHKEKKNPCEVCISNIFRLSHSTISSKVSSTKYQTDPMKSPSSQTFSGWHQLPVSPVQYYLLMKAECFTIWTAHADNRAFSLTIGPSRCLAVCWGNRAAQQHIGGSEEASDAPGHVPRPASPHNLACSVPTQWQTHLRWQLWWTLSSVLVTNAEIIRSYPRKCLIIMHCYCCSHPDIISREVLLLLHFFFY